MPLSPGEAGFPSSLPLKPISGRLTATALPDKFDLIIFSNVLNELVDATKDVRADIVTPAL